ncbi:unnamed protein product [Protopolystoma xenopodis]|uniref:Uncharacterized protein n=1 Tax=Protopolystoma xenopodis TaxID=117903 RepID=A0A448WDU7_9PLAT|nr:unnamed protein product [Protopolystoma xenopodis]
MHSTGNFPFFQAGSRQRLMQQKDLDFVGHKQELEQIKLSQDSVSFDLDEWLAASLPGSLASAQKIPFLQSGREVEAPSTSCSPSSQQLVPHSPRSPYHQPPGHLEPAQTRPFNESALRYDESAFSQPSTPGGSVKKRSANFGCCPEPRRPRSIRSVRRTVVSATSLSLSSSAGCQAPGNTTSRGLGELESGLPEGGSDKRFLLAKQTGELVK